MKIKILKCRDSILWYNRYIGKTFEVWNAGTACFWVREPDEYRCLNFVLIDDCEVVDETEV